MKLFRFTPVALLTFAALSVVVATTTSAEPRSRLHRFSRRSFQANPEIQKSRNNLNIRRDARTGRVVLSWQGRGVLKRATGWNRNFQRLYQGASQFVVEPTESVALYSLGDGGGVYSGNVVGYVMVRLPPGLSLIANPLYQTNNTLAVLWQGVWSPPPDGCQIFKYGADSSYEVSTYDAVSGKWSNPNLDITIGKGFFFNNPSSMTVTQTFVGEVLQGWLINPLPAGVTTKGALVPQMGSINDIHLIPGDPGDEIRTYVNDGNGGGYYNTSVFDADTQRWQPDLILNVAEGFWISKQQADDWIRFFMVQ